MPWRDLTKEAYCRTRELLDSGAVYPTWGRQQSAAVDSYAENFEACDVPYWSYEAELEQNLGFLWQSDLYFPTIDAIEHLSALNMATHQIGREYENHALGVIAVPDKTRDFVVEQPIADAIRKSLSNLLELVSSAEVDTLSLQIRNSSGSTETSRLLQSFLENVIQQNLRVAQAKTEGIVLEEFLGVVDRIEGERAFVTLTSESGEELIGEYSSNELTKLGIHERRRFICQTVEVESNVEVKLMAIPDLDVSPDKEAIIDRELDELIAGDELTGDY